MGPKCAVRQRLKEDQDVSGIVKTNHAGTPLAEIKLCAATLSRGKWVVFTVRLD